jgi:hypothetical protein
MADIDELAEQASRATSRWYGRVATFEDYINRMPMLSCAEWFKAHWRAHPSASPVADAAFWDGVEGDG